MKTLLKLAMGAALAGALVNMLMRQRSGSGATSQDLSGQNSTSDGPDAGYDQNAGSTFTVEELVAEQREFQ